MTRSRQGQVLIVAALAAVAAVSGGAAALATSESEEIRGCYHAETGLLRIADDCRPHELAIEWNRHGPQGPPGPQGVDGPPGPSTAFLTETGFRFLRLDGPTVIATIALSAGTYVVTAKTTTDAATDCRLQLGGDIRDLSSAVAFDDSNAGVVRPFVLAGELTEPDSVTLFCFTRSGGASAGPAKIIATKVGNLVTGN